MPRHLFKPGESGNPGGRPKLTEAQRLAREYTTMALETLVGCLEVPKERVPAAIALLDRGWGKPAQALTGADGAALRTVIHVVTGVPRDDAPAEGDPEAGFGEWRPDTTTNQS